MVKSKTLTTLELERLKREREELKKRKLIAQKRLPHLYKHKFYTWSREFFETRKHIALLTAANQIGKSTIQIIKVIEWATNKKLWPELWPNLMPGEVPNLFWYLYPSSLVVNQEWKTKWLPLMPRRDDPEFGWKEIIGAQSKIEAVQFKSGVLLAFKTYGQDAQMLQSGSVFYCGCDEELPCDLWDELTMRTSATDGYFSCVFTATLGQEFWRLAMEPSAEEKKTGREKFPGAFKRSVSKFDCLEYEDGSKGKYTLEKIQKELALCGTTAEALKRIYGRFVVSGGRTYEAFSPVENTKDPFQIPTDWLRVAGIDSGAGGEETDIVTHKGVRRKRRNDPAAIVFLALSPDYQQGVVYKAWRGDHVVTTSGDIVNKFIEMRGDELIEYVYYDYSDKDLQIIAQRVGEGFTKADKAKNSGEGVLNTLFKNHMLTIFNDSEGLQQLVQELATLRKDAADSKAVDHLCDALRYACAKVPWDFSLITGAPVEHNVDPKLKERDRKQSRLGRWADGRAAEADESEDYATIEEEFEEANAMYGE